MDDETMSVRDDLVENGLMTKKQADAYCNHVIDMESRSRSTKVGASSFHDRLREARDHVEVFMDTLVTLRTHGVVPVRQSSNSKQWHRIDWEGCYSSVSVMPSNPNRERLAFKDDVEELAGELCDECFPEI